jgi:ATP-dependent helicase HrpB
MADAPLPIDAVLPELLQALARHGRAVLQAPPGAGKTTRVPLALLRSGQVTGRILMLEPRRLAARASAERMAATLGEPVGQTVGYAMRGAVRTGPDTRIEVITEGLLTRRLQSDPGLEGVGAVLFDEFHERSLQADLGLALTWELRGALREDLQILVMSATLDAGPVAALMDDAPVVTAEGRAYPVDTRWRDGAVPRMTRIEAATAETVLAALAETAGGVLVFLPGESEIRRTMAALSGRLPNGVDLHPLYGALPPAAQRAAIAPAREGRKLVLATTIAETSLTIEDIRVVVDAGLSRRARFDPGSGMSRLVTDRVTRAEADQRRGRAGRVAPGVCYRLWTRGEEGALAAYPPAEIEAADLTGLALDLAQWGAEPEALAFLTPPPPAALNEARALLRSLGALDAAGRITPHGTTLAALPLHPRLAHMMAVAGPQAAPLAALLSDRDPLRGAGTDLARRLDALAGRTGADGGDAGALARIRTEARRLARRPPRTKGETPRLSPGEMAALAYPDRIALRRPGDAPRYLLSGGKGAVLDAADALSGQRLLVAVDLDGDRTEARVRLAAPLAESELRALYGTAIETVETCSWDARARRVAALRQDRFGALVLSESRWADAPADALAAATLEGVRHLGLSALKPSDRFRLLRARLAVARAVQPDLPDPDEAALLRSADQWLLPWLDGVRTAADLARVDAGQALAAALDHAQTTALDRIAPGSWTTPAGRRVEIDFGGDAPEVSVRLQEVFGVTRHPQVGGRPLRLTLLSPARRPVQTTTDLPGFWSGSYAEVRKDMRARYPRHPWPDDPAEAAPTLRAKPRGT